MARPKISAAVREFASDSYFCGAVNAPGSAAEEGATQHATIIVNPAADLDNLIWVSHWYHTAGYVVYCDVICCATRLLWDDCN